MAGGVVAVVMAGGSGTRMGVDGNKVYLPLGGRPMLAWAIATLATSSHVDAVVVVVRAGDEVAARAAAGGHEVAAIVPGGPTRHASEQAGLAAVRALLAGGLECDLTLVHDGARPFLTDDLLDALVAAARRDGGAVPVLPFAGPLAAESDDGSLRLVPTDDLVRVQTPQVFAMQPLLDAYAAALADRFDGVDTAEVVERYAPSLTIAAVPGDPRNVKVTTPADLPVAESLAARFTDDR